MIIKSGNIVKHHNFINEYIYIKYINNTHCNYKWLSNDYYREFTVENYYLESLYLSLVTSIFQENIYEI